MHGFLFMLKYGLKIRKFGHFTQFNCNFRRYENMPQVKKISANSWDRNTMNFCVKRRLQGLRFVSKNVVLLFYNTFINLTNDDFMRIISIFTNFCFSALPKPNKSHTILQIKAKIRFEFVPYFSVSGQPY